MKCQVISKLIKKMARSIVMKDLKKAEDISYGEVSCEGCPEVCPLGAIGGWDLCEIIEIAGPLKDKRERGIVAK